MLIIPFGMAIRPSPKLQGEMRSGSERPHPSGCEGCSLQGERQTAGDGSGLAGIGRSNDATNCGILWVIKRGKNGSYSQLEFILVNN